VRESLTMQPLVTCALAGNYTFQASYFSFPRFISHFSIVILLLQSALQPLMGFGLLSVVIRTLHMKCICEKWVSVVT
jgi:hypothetical protein